MTLIVALHNSLHDKRAAFILHSTMQVIPPDRVKAIRQELCPHGCCTGVLHEEGPSGKYRLGVKILRDTITPGAVEVYVTSSALRKEIKALMGEEEKTDENSSEQQLLLEQGFAGTLRRDTELHAQSEQPGAEAKPLEETLSEIQSAVVDELESRRDNPDD